MKVDIPADIMLQLAETELEAEVNKVLEKYGIGASIAVKIIETILVNKEKEKGAILAAGLAEIASKLNEKEEKNCSQSENQN